MMSSTDQGDAMLIKVLRVEDQDGNGPYASHKVDAIIGNFNMFDNYQHPDPFKDIPAFRGLSYSRVAGKYNFGFRTVDQMLQWFPQHVLDAFKQRGFNVVEITIEDRYVNKGQKQVAFHTDKVVRKEVLQ